ncbi:DinB family protein [Bacillus sp. M6-12]|uniref:DinB family protein n=1 Tax=Bacillus sp. M6-12 TaxID=2054166 RepID=UPI000C78E7F9|nr:DinB family protein [Bacillus sp. M6-12]PLS18279.1 DinB family protein [Bacillus sp. M6-12]
MSELLYKQFELTNIFIVRTLEGIEKEMLDIQPEGFNNNIRWHAGHILTVTEQFMFGFPKKSAHLPENYIELFGPGTKPSEWQGDAPSIEELTAQLKEQVIRIKDIPFERLDEKLKKPFLDLETFGELANMAVYHQSYHLGQVHAMKRVIANSAIKN